MKSTGSHKSDTKSDIVRLVSITTGNDFIYSPMIPVRPNSSGKEDCNRTKRSKKHRRTVVMKRELNRFPDVSLMFATSYSDTLRHHDQIIHHDTKHENERERNDIVERIAKRLQYNEIDKIDDKKRNQHDK